MGWDGRPHKDAGEGKVFLMRIRNVAEKEKIELQMTAMIDIVFLLLIFFVMTFKVVQMEGDFNIRMPSAAPSQNAMDEELLPPMTLRLTADTEGRLTGIRLNQQRFTNFHDLHAEIMDIVGTEAGPDSGLTGGEIELDCDFDLAYEHVIAAITAVTGHRTEDGAIIKLIEKIKFAPPKKTQSRAAEPS
jgi:biopolymer transport protein ExbD